MKHVNCSDPNCRNYDRYCRIHKQEVIKPAKPIAKKSEGLKEEMKKYTKLAKLFLAMHTKCAVCKTVRSQCIHHMAGRVGENLRDRKTFLAVCFDCHRKIEENPDWAKENGYSVSRLNKKV